MCVEVEPFVSPCGTVSRSYTSFCRILCRILARVVACWGLGDSIDQTAVVEDVKIVAWC